PAEPFDIVFLDPPFDANLWSEAAAALDEGGWLRPGALVYLESPRNAKPSVPPTWQFHKDARAGDVQGTLWRVPASNDQGDGSRAEESPVTQTQP
ncbi:MAG TPA: RsmD family RNA methyltransferase, partial [Xanthomonadaceae bacterium]|nr:RsmD family RNA methyltransferase [Xanthomonadaceae bacterium]